MKKLVYVSDAYLSTFRANAVHVMKMCSAFASLNYKTYLYCHDSGYNENILDEYGVQNRFEIVTFLNKKLKYLNHNLRLLYSCWRNARNINKEHKDSIVYGRSLFTLLFVRNNNYIYESHTIATNPLLKWSEKLIIKRKNFKKIVVISEQLKKAYLNMGYGLNENDILVLHDGADEVPSSFIKIPEIDNQESEYPDIIVGYIGSLYPGKCMEVLLPLAKRMTEIIIHVWGGDKEWVNYWKEESYRQNIYNIKFYGNIKPSKIIEYYNAIDIFLLPYSNKIYLGKSKKHEIGKWISPLKLFEAMSFGKAIISSNLDTIKEVVNNQVEAILLSPTDIDEWVININNLLTNKKQREYLGENAKRKFLNQYSWKKRAEFIINTYNND